MLIALIIVIVLLVSLSGRDKIINLETDSGNIDISESESESESSAVTDLKINQGGLVGIFSGSRIDGNSSTSSNSSSVASDGQQEAANDLIVTEGDDSALSYNEQKIFDASVEYVDKLEAFQNQEEGILEDYSNAFDDYRDGLVEFPTDDTLQLWQDFQEELGEIQAAWSDFSDTVYRYEDDINLRSAIYDIYPRPTEEVYSQVPQVNDFFADDLKYYSYGKLSSTLDYSAFFGVYGYSVANNEYLEYMKSGLVDAVNNNYTSKVQCAGYSNNYYKDGCEAYIDSILMETQVSDINSILSQYD